MSQSSAKLEQGFRLRECTVIPTRHVIVRDGLETHLEPKAMQVLLQLALQPGEVVSREELLEQVWPETYSGDAALTRCISLLRSSLGDDSRNPRFIETVSKTGYRLLAPVEETPKPTSSLKMPRLAWLGLAAILIVLSYWIAGPQITSEEVAPEASRSSEPSIAVLPFDNMSGNAADVFLSDGVAEEILNRLAQVPSLKVISRSSSFVYRDTEDSIQNIAAQLSVDHMLEGSIRKSGDHIRVAVQLIDVEDGELIWSETYDRQSKDLLTLQDEIAHAVVSALKITFDLAGDAAEPVSPEAYESLLRGRYLAAQRTEASLESAVEEFQASLRANPDYALAHAELAMTYLLLRRANYGSLNELESIRLAQPHATLAMNLAPQLAEAHAAAGMVAWRNGDAVEAERHFNHAIEINPNYAIVYHWLAMVSYRFLGRHVEAMAASSKARQLDPVAVPILNIYIQMLTLRGQLAKAELEIQNLQKISEPNAAWLRGDFNSLNGRWANSVLGMLEAWRLEPDSSRSRNRFGRQLVVLGLARQELPALEPINSPLTLAYMGRFDKAVQVADANFRKDPSSVVYLRQLATALAHQGDYQRARPLLEALWERSNHYVAMISSGMFTFKQAVMLWAIRQDAGDTKGADQIAAQMLADARDIREAGIYINRIWSGIDFVEGVALYLADNQEEGLRLMEKAVREGHFIRVHPPLLPGLFSDPAFKEILATQQSRQAQEQQKFFAAVCQDSRYAALWQPAEAGCAGFLEHSGVGVARLDSQWDAHGRINEQENRPDHQEAH